jgi:hypothetical protein
MRRRSSSRPTRISFAIDPFENVTTRAAFVFELCVRDETCRESRMQRAEIAQHRPDFISIRVDQNFFGDGRHDVLRVAFFVGEKTLRRCGMGRNLSLVMVSVYGHFTLGCIWDKISSS